MEYADLLTETLGRPMDVAEVIALEQRIASQGISLRELMERAGSALVACMRIHAPASAGNVCVLAGTGNNGGDGWVAARLLAQSGSRVNLITKRAAEDIAAQPAHDAACETIAAIEIEDLPISVYVDPDEERVDDLLTHADAIIDAILGTGFSATALRAPYDMWIVHANKARELGTWIFAADTPSGLSAQEGSAADPCIRADFTVTMLAAKTGLVAPDAKAYTGRLVLAPLGIR